MGKKPRYSAADKMGEILPGGTREERPEGAGHPIDLNWWKSTAEEIFRRLPCGPGAGDGPDPKDVDVFAEVLSRLFHDGDQAEEALRATYLLPTGSTAELREPFVAMLISGVGPEVAAIRSRQSAVAEPKRSSAAQRGKPVAPPTRGPFSPSDTMPGYPVASRESRACIHVFGEPERAFEDASIQRELMHQTYREGLGRRGNGFEAEVPLQTEVWRGYYRQAALLAEQARGVVQEFADDYNCPEGSAPFDYRQRLGAGSTSAVGVAVHTALQSRYRTIYNEGLHHGVVTETKWYPPPGVVATDVLGVPLNLRRDILDSSTPLAALAFALGDPRAPLRIDIVDMETSELYEIKPVRGAHEGVLQAWQYIDNANLARFWAERTKTGARREAGQKAWRLVPGQVASAMLGPIPLSLWLPAGFSGRGKDWIAMPYALPAVPGLIFYTLEEGFEEHRKLLDKLLRAAGTAVIALALVIIVAAVIAELAPVAGQALAAFGELAKEGAQFTTAGVEKFVLMTAGGPQPLVGPGSALTFEQISEGVQQATKVLSQMQAR